MAGVHVCRLDELTAERALLVPYGRYGIGVFRVGERIYAFENRCLHQGGPVCLGGVYGSVEAVLDDRGALIEERYVQHPQHLVCPWHGWEYALDTGRCRTSPSVALTAYRAWVDAGEVYVDLPERDSPLEPENH